MKRFLISLLAASLMVSTCSCGGSSAPTNGDDTKPSDTTPIEEHRSEFSKIAAENFDGYAFNVLSFNRDVLLKWIDAETENGDIFNDAIYARNRAVEDLYNVTISVQEYDENTAYNTLINEVMSGSSTFDMTFQWAMKIPSAAAEGVLLNLLDIPELDTSKPWWTQNAVKAFELVPGKLYFAANAITCNNVDFNGGSLYFNSRLIEEYNLENPYDLVRSGEWTLDKVYSMMTAVASNADGQDTRTAEDMYGIVSAWGNVGGFYHGVGCSLGDVVNEGGKTTMNVSFHTEKAIAVAEWVDKVASDSTLMADMLSDSEWAKEAFFTGHALFYTAGVYGLNELRSQMEDDFGLVPYPKADESQGAYYASCGGRNAPLFGIPASVEDASKTAKIVEALNIYSYENLIDTYMDATLIGKCARDENTEEMLSLIIDNIFYDVGMVTVPELFDKWYPAVQQGGETLTSTAESIRTSVQSHFNDIVEKMAALD